MCELIIHFYFTHEEAESEKNNNKHRQESNKWLFDVKFQNLSTTQKSQKGIGYTTLHFHI